MFYPYTLNIKIFQIEENKLSIKLKIDTLFETSKTAPQLTMLMKWPILEDSF